MKKQICSNDHFKRLLKSFKKISLRVCEDYKDAEFYEDFEYFIGEDNFNNFYYSVSFQECINKLFKNFKLNPFKTKSGYLSENEVDGINKFFVTYTFEDELGKRSVNTKNVVFRIFVKSDYRKKRLVKWSVPVNWEYLK